MSPIKTTTCSNGIFVNMQTNPQMPGTIKDTTNFNDINGMNEFKSIIGLDVHDESLHNIENNPTLFTMIPIRSKKPA